MVVTRSGQNGAAVRVGSGGGWRVQLRLYDGESLSWTQEMWGGGQVEPVLGLHKTPGHSRASPHSLAGRPSQVRLSSEA